jgi:DNA-binding Lrp family transcriptional regulator
MGNRYIDAFDDFPNEHSLIKLWNIYRGKIVPEVNDSENTKDLLDNIERILSQFNTEDPESMSFRYPVTKSPKRDFHVKRRTLDIKNFKDVIDKVIHYFEWQYELLMYSQDVKDDIIASYQDEWA